MLTVFANAIRITWAPCLGLDQHGLAAAHVSVKINKLMAVILNLILSGGLPYKCCLFWRDLPVQHLLHWLGYLDGVVLVWQLLL